MSDHCRVALLVALALLGSCLPAAAQVVPRAAPPDTEVAPVGPPSPNDIRELSRLLTDPRMAQWLAEMAASPEAAAADVDDNPSLQEWLAQRLAARELHVARTVGAWSELEAVLGRFKGKWQAAVDRGESLRSLVYVVIFLVVGAGLEWLYWRYAWTIRRRIERQALSGAAQGWRPTALRAALQLIGIALFTAGTLVTFLVFEWPPLVSLLVLSLLLAVISVRFINALAVFVLCPRVAALRPIALATPSARFVYRWLMSIATTLCVGGYAHAALREMGIASRLPVIVLTTTGTLVLLLSLVALKRWRNSQRARHGEDDSGGDVGYAAMATVLVALWALWLGGAFGLMWTAVIVIALLLVDRACKRLLRPPAPAEPDDAARPELAATTAEVDAEPAGRADDVVVGPQLYKPVLERLVRFIAVVAAIFAAGGAWGIDWWQLSESSSLAGRILVASIDILVAALIADLIWTWARTAIDTRMADYEPPTAGQAPGPEARLATLLPLLRTILLITLIVLVALIGLSSLGVNIGPLLASAGVVGIAIGFGAQTLVRDIVSGIFFLLDDAFRVGEYIEIDTLRGTVESISVRSLRLRHHRGAVHTIPFGEMKSLTNHSRDWVIVKLEFRVPFDTDLKLVKKLVKQVGAELASNDELGPKFIEPLKSQGVRRMEEFNMVVGVKFMSRPGEQWVIRRETYQRVRDAFDANGIKLAERNVKVEVVGGEALSDAEREAIVGAAQDAVEAPALAPGALPGRA